MWTSCCVWWYKFQPSSSKFFWAELEITIFGQNWQVSQGCHSNGPIYHDEILQVHSTCPGVHLMSLHQTAIYNSLGAISESLIFQRFWAEIRSFSLKTLRLLQFLSWRPASGFIRKLIILPRDTRRGFPIYIVVSEKSELKMASVGQKWGFSMLPWQRCTGAGKTTKSPGRVIDIHVPAKFHQDRFSHLGCRGATHIQTSRMTYSVTGLNRKKTKLID